MPFKTVAQDPTPKKKVFVIQPETPYDFLEDKMPNYTALEPTLGHLSMIAYTVTEFDYSEGESVFGETRQFTIPPFLFRFSLTSSFFLTSPLSLSIWRNSFLYIVNPNGPFEGHLLC